MPGLPQAHQNVQSAESVAMLSCSRVALRMCASRDRQHIQSIPEVAYMHTFQIARIPRFNDSLEGHFSVSGLFRRLLLSIRQN